MQEYLEANCKAVAHGVRARAVQGGASSQAKEVDCQLQLACISLMTFLDMALGQTFISISLPQRFTVLRSKSQSDVVPAAVVLAAAALSSRSKTSRNTCGASMAL